MGREHRIIDANANRAREALRVMEDAARFGLDHQPLCADLKQLRHDLRGALDGFDPGLLLASRDTPGDVGTHVSAESEGRRSSLREVAIAAGARLAEALRVLEECAKTLNADATAIEAIRYRAYAAEKELILAFGAGRSASWRVCLIITESLCAHHAWERTAELAMDGGADCVQLREKSLGDMELVRRARRLVELARPRDVSVIINDRVDVALAADAHGVHLGLGDLPVRDARRLAGFRLLIGVSTTDMDQARQAVRDGADYCGVGPMFPTTTKDTPSIAGPAYLRQYLADPVTASRPHLAIGGITPRNIGKLVAAGCRGVAVSSAICAAEHPEEIVRTLRHVHDAHSGAGEEAAPAAAAARSRLADA